MQQSPNIRGHSAKFRFSLSKKIGIVFLILALLGLGNILVVRTMYVQFSGYNNAMAIVGKLRFLSHRVALNTSSALNGWSPGKEAALSDIVQYENALNMLMHQGRWNNDHHIRQMAPPQLVILAELTNTWRPYSEGIKSTLLGNNPARPDTSQFVALTEGSQRLQGYAEQLMVSLIAKINQEQEDALKIGYLLLTVDILLLGVMWLLVRIGFVHPLLRLTQGSRELANGNYQVHIEYRYDDEVGQLAKAFNYSAQQIGTLIDNLEQKHLSLLQAEAMFRGIAETPAVGVYIIQDNKFAFANEKIAQMFGVEQQALLDSLSLFDLLEEADHDRFKANTQKRMDGIVEGLDNEYQVHRRDRSQFDLAMYGSRMSLNGRPAMIGMTLDITARKQAEASMRMAAMVYKSCSEGMVITDAGGLLMDANPAFTRITGYSREEVLGRPISIVNSGHHDKVFFQAMWGALNADGHWQGEVWNRRKNGEMYPQWLTINTFYNQDGSAHRRVALFSDITDKKKTEALVWRQANFDSLTGLPNRMMFHDRLEQEIHKSAPGLSMALIFIDLDHFKEINDTLGHAAGDLLLQQAAQRLSSCVRATDTVARLGGDEFTIILGDLTCTDNAERIVQDVLTNMAEPFNLGDDVAYVSASIGITFYPDDASGSEELLKNADLAMYASKNLGRNRFHYFLPHLREEALMRQRRMVLAEEQPRV